jgi:signal transduction histidine kinase
MVEILLGLLALALLWLTQLRRQVEERASELKEHIRARQIVENKAVMVEERARIAQDLHDELGSGLTEIGMLGARARSASLTDQARSGFVQQMSDRALQTVATLDEIVWAMNPRHDTLDSMLTYFSIYAERFLGLADIAWRFERHGTTPDRPVEPGCRHDLFIAFKEALTNIVRHSAATEVSLSARLELRTLRLTLTDNGAGFSPGLVGNGGNGLANMRARLERAGGRFEAASSPNHGTTLRFLVPLP